ncbi:MAG: CopG family transcriptional regulator [Candidatus Limnocylindrales bacterium]
MRTTIDLDEDVAAAVAQLRRSGVGVSEAVNRLARAGLTAKPARGKFHQQSAPIGIRIDVTNVAEAVELLDETLSDRAAGGPRRVAESQVPLDDPPDR